MTKTQASHARLHAQAQDQAFPLVFADVDRDMPRAFTVPAWSRARDRVDAVGDASCEEGVEGAANGDHRKNPLDRWELLAPRPAEHLDRFVLSEREPCLREESQTFLRVDFLSPLD